MIFGVPFQSMATSHHFQFYGSFGGSVLRIIIQKYGGTSVNTKENRSYIIKNAKIALEAGQKPVIVVSAMGRYPESYSTDALLSLLPDCELAEKRSKDLLASCGEIITSVIVSEELKQNNLLAIPLTGGQAGILTDQNYGEGKILDIDTTHLLELLEQDYIPVVAGFQGMSDEKEVLTLGRGGSDITATALGGALNAESIEIYTDVDGVMTADPNMVESAELLDVIEYRDVFQLAEYGAKVIHPRAVEFAMKANVPVLILNVRKGHNSEFTVINDGSELPRSESMFNAITCLPDCSQVELIFTDLKKEDLMFTRLAESNISIDMINIFPDRKNFIIKHDDKYKLSQIMKNLELDYTIKDNFTKITILGSKICGVPGVMARIIAALYSNDIAVYQSSDSSSTISVLVESAQAQTAVNLLHKSLIK
jgi:aspartate kinase